MSWRQKVKVHDSRAAVSEPRCPSQSAVIYLHTSYTRIKIYFALLALDRLDLLLQFVGKLARHLLGLDSHAVHPRLALKVKANELDHETIDRRVELLVDSHVLS